jgi:hypothetical protein
VIEEVSLSDDVATRFASMVSAQVRQERPVSTAGQTDAPPLLPDAVQSLAGVLSPPMDEELNVDQSQRSTELPSVVDPAQPTKQFKVFCKNSLNVHFVSP